jgi:hypothetical protein
MWRYSKLNAETILRNIWKKTKKKNRGLSVDVMGGFSIGSGFSN